MLNEESGGFKINVTLYPPLILTFYMLKNKKATLSILDVYCLFLLLSHDLE